MHTLSNPLSMQNCSDPFLTYDKKLGYYYLLATEGRGIMTVFRSRELGTILTGGEQRDVYVCKTGGAFGPLWAPEMYKIGGKWYIYTSCQEDPQCTVKRLFILQSKTEDPFDGFEYGAKPDTSIYAIDPTSAVIDGVQYICYSEVDPERHLQRLVIREMKDPLTFTNNLAPIAYPELPWELVPPYTGHRAIAEGAFFLQHGGRLFIIYSANGCWSDDYCLGVLEHTGGPICDASRWFKHEKPLFKKGNGVFGPGHASFFESPDGSEVWCAYHCLLKSNPDCTPVPRYTCVQKIAFDGQGYPVMTEPVGIGNTIPAPTGE